MKRIKRNFSWSIRSSAQQPKVHVANRRSPAPTPTTPSTPRGTFATANQNAAVVTVHLESSRPHCLGESVAIFRTLMFIAILAIFCLCFVACKLIVGFLPFFSVFSSLLVKKTGLPDSSANCKSYF